MAADDGADAILRDPVLEALLVMMERGRGWGRGLVLMGVGQRVGVRVVDDGLVRRVTAVRVWELGGVVRVDGDDLVGGDGHDLEGGLVVDVGVERHIGER